MSDKIAYINHDIDDAIRAKILTENDIPLKYRKVLGHSTKDRLDTLVHNMIINSMDKNDICMSPEVEEAMKGLRQFMFDNLYRNSIAKTEETKAKELLRRLFFYYMERPEIMPEQFTRMIVDGEKVDRVVCDYIAGMTDQYAIAKFNEFFVPLAWQVN